MRALGAGAEFRTSRDTDTSENHYDSGSDSDDDEDDQKSTAESRFSYFSIRTNTYSELFLILNS